MKRAGRIVLLCSFGLLPAFAYSQARPFPGPDVQQIYQRLLPQIEKIPAFDHHAHPGYADDPDVDAMAAPPNASEPLRTRDDNVELAAAAKALFGYPYNDLSPEHSKWLLDKKTELKKQLAGPAYFNSILDKINIESSVANRAMMADYLDAKRFPWVFFGDAFMWPFNNERETGRNPDEGVFIPLQEKMLHRWMQQENVSKLPATFADYLKFVTQTLEDNSKHGGIAIKFEVAYFRPMSFSDPSRAEAEDIYLRFVGGGIPTEKEYRAFQDYIFRYLVVEGGRLHLPIHIHTAVGIGDYFNSVEEQHHEPGERVARPALRFDDVRDDSWRVSAGARGDLARGDEECLSRFVIWGVGAVSVGIQRHAKDVAGDVSRQDHVWDGLLPVQSGLGRRRELLAGRSIGAHGIGRRAG